MLIARKSLATNYTSRRSNPIEVSYASHDFVSIVSVYDKMPARAWPSKEGVCCGLIEWFNADFRRRLDVSHQRSLYCESSDPTDLSLHHRVLGTFTWLRSVDSCVIARRSHDHGRILGLRHVVLQKTHAAMRNTAPCVPRLICTCHQCRPFDRCGVTGHGLAFPTSSLSSDVGVQSI